MDTVTIKDKKFRISIPDTEIGAAVSRVAQRINAELQDQEPIFLCVLNGSFMFAADLMKHVNIECEVAFVKLASYHGGLESSGAVKQLIGLTKNIRDRAIVIVEDIVDTGNTIEHLVDQLKGHHPKSIQIATLLYKPEAYTKDIPVDFVALEVPNLFLVGYGLDYDERGRNLKDIYVLHEEA